MAVPSAGDFIYGFLLAGLLVLIPVCFIELIRLLDGWVTAKRRLWDAEASLASRIGRGEPLNGQL